MSQRIAAFAFVLVCVVALPVTARADGMYFAFDGGRSYFKDACKGVSDCNDVGTALRLAAGYNFAHLWEAFTPGIEIGLTDLGEAKFSGGGFKARAVQVEAAGSLAVGAGFSVIAKLGAVEAYSKLDNGVQGFGTPGASTTRLNAACAIGGQYDFGRQLGIRAQYENLRTFGDSVAAGETNVRVISAGLVYRP